MRHLIAALPLVLAACGIPTFELYQSDPVAVIEDNGYTIREARGLIVWGLTDCATKTVWMRPQAEHGKGWTTMLSHESVHVLQAEEMGCARFITRYAINPDPYEMDALLQQYYFIHCNEAGRKVLLRSISFGYPSLLEEATELFHPSLCD